ncbi:hypothetical protein P7M46_09355 [Bisgaard Taxon 10/6]|uniref:N-acyl amino acid synthase FeeM domain-containing protein n=1 Tax=Exercitatus varius TaxID=67857 RepID=UPI00294B71FE|nr:hypothetical protein [Exercitatus varius]MDG2918204.1 hypothetical protein [Exercitatus varius]
MNRKYEKLSHQLDKLPFIDELRIKFATTSDEFLQAMKLIHQAYKKKGLVNDNKECYFSPYILLPKNKIIVIKKNQKVIGTISVIEDSPLGIPMDKVHPEDINSLRKKKINFIEIGAFAIAPKYHHYGLSLLLYRAAFIYINQYTNADCAVIAVHPRVSKLYNNLFQFEVFGNEKEYESLNDAKSIPLLAKSSNSVKFIKNNKILSRDIEKNNILSEYTDSLNIYDSEGKDIDNIFIWNDNCILNYFNKCEIKLNQLPLKQKELLDWLYPVLRSHSSID